MWGKSELISLIYRTVGFCFDLKYEVEDLEETWDFTKKENLESDDEEEEATPGLKEVKELTYEDIEKVNNALKSQTFCVQELKRKVEHKLYMAESAAIAGWGPVSVLENKIYDNVSGANAAEKEMKTQKIRKATETYAKEQRLHMKGEPGNGVPFKLKKRPNYLHGTSFKKFGGGPRSSAGPEATTATPPWPRLLGVREAAGRAAEVAREGATEVAGGAEAPATKGLQGSGEASGRPEPATGRYTC